jgi:hypothetical protein
MSDDPLVPAEAGTQFFGQKVDARFCGYARSA